MMRSGKAWIIAVAVFVAILVMVALVFFGWYIPSYNKAVSLNESVQKGWSDVDTQLQRRLDLIPNLVNTVKGYATHEKELFENIAKSRENYFQAKTPADKIAASNQLSGFLSRLLVLRETYPDLKANQNFRDLQVQLEGTENRISVARTRYNEVARTLNNYAKSYFGRFICSRANIAPAAYFEATEAAQTTVPEVQF